MFVEPVLPHIVRDIEDIPGFLQDKNSKALQNQTNATLHSTDSNSIAVGVIFAAKPFWEFVANPIIGWTIDRFKIVIFYTYCACWDE